VGTPLAWCVSPVTRAYPTLYQGEHKSASG
jgi:hypothetical protein